MDSQEELWSRNATCTPLLTSHWLRTSLRGGNNLLGSFGPRRLLLVKDNSQGKAAALYSWGWVQRDLSRAPAVPTTRAYMSQGPGVGFGLSISTRATLEFDDELPSLSRISPENSHYKAPGPWVWKTAGSRDRDPDDASDQRKILPPRGCLSDTQPKGKAAPFCTSRARC